MAAGGEHLRRRRGGVVRRASRDAPRLRRIWCYTASSMRSTASHYCPQMLPGRELWCDECRPCSTEGRSILCDAQLFPCGQRQAAISPEAYLSSRRRFGSVATQGSPRPWPSLSSPGTSLYPIHFISH
ncbi:hypothetical protein SEVIR_7G006205v4 [Setaria viridis]